MCTGGVFINTAYAQQDSQYTQYMYNTGTINPAYVGSRGMFELTSLYRSQWIGVEGEPKTLNFTTNMPLKEKSGLGIAFIQDQIGPSRESTITGDFSYTIPVADNLSLSFGIKGGLNILNIDYSILNIKPDGVFQYNIEDRVTPIIGSGVYLYNNTWYAGLSIPNMLKTTHYDNSSLSNATEKPHIYVIGGYVFTLNNSILFNPAILGKFVIGAPASIDVSASFLFNDHLTLGLAYRFNAAVSGLFGFQISEKIMMGISYDYTITDFNTSPSSLEFFLRFDIAKYAKRCKCVNPRFF